MSASGFISALRESICIGIAAVSIATLHGAVSVTASRDYVNRQITNTVPGLVGSIVTNEIQRQIVTITNDFPATICSVVTNYDLGLVKNSNVTNITDSIVTRRAFKGWSDWTYTLDGDPIDTYRVVEVLADTYYWELQMQVDGVWTNLTSSGEQIAYWVNTNDVSDVIVYDDGTDGYQSHVDGKLVCRREAITTNVLGLARLSDVPTNNVQLANGAGYVVSNDVALAPAYSDTPTYRWTCVPAAFGAFSIEIVADSSSADTYAPYSDGRQIGTSLTLASGEDTITWRADMDWFGRSDLTATRVRTDLVGYTLGDQTDIVLASTNFISHSSGDITTNDVYNIVSNAVALSPVYSQTPAYGSDWTYEGLYEGHTVIKSPEFYEAYGPHPAHWEMEEFDGTQGYVTYDYDSGADASTLHFGSDGTITATRVRTDIIGYTLGSQTNFVLATTNNTSHGATQKRYAMFIIQLNVPGDANQFVDVELKASTNNFSASAADAYKLTYYCHTSIPGGTYQGSTMDGFRLYSSSQAGDRRIWAKCPTMDSAPNQTPATIAIIVSPDVCVRTDGMWLDESNEEIVWSYLRSTSSGRETDSYGEVWRQIEPIKWMEALPNWAQ